MLYANGVRTASLSLDGAVAETHEQVRQIPGHFDETIRAIGLLKDHGLAVQINSAVMAQNVRELADLAALLVREAVSTWEVFFLIGVGTRTRDRRDRERRVRGRLSLPRRRRPVRDDCADGGSAFFPPGP